MVFKNDAKGFVEINLPDVSLNCVEKDHDLLEEWLPENKLIDGCF